MGSTFRGSLIQPAINQKKLTVREFWTLVGHLRISRKVVDHTLQSTVVDHRQHKLVHIMSHTIIGKVLIMTINTMGGKDIPDGLFPCNNGRITILDSVKLFLTVKSA
jgi:hypothetical protein